MTVLKLSPYSFNHVPLLRTFFRIYQAKEWLSRDTGPLGGVERRRDASRDVEINRNIARYSRQ